MNEHEQRIYTELLVVRSQQGEKEAFEAIVDLWQKPLLGFALRYLGAEMDARDAVQETWVAVVRGLRRLQNPSLFVSWAFRILTNKCIDRLRDRQRQMQKLQQPPLAISPPETSDEREHLRHAIARLDGDYQTVITLRFEQGLSVPQIAAMLDIPEGTVKSRLHRALTRLREILEVES